MSRIRIGIFAVAAVLLVAGSGVADGAASAVPHWLLVRVHELVASDQNQNAEIAALQAQVAKDDAAIATLQSQAAQTTQALQCLRPLGVSLARVRAETGRTRMVLRLPTAGAAPVYRLVRFRAAC